VLNEAVMQRVVLEGTGRNLGEHLRIVTGLSPSCLDILAEAPHLIDEHSLSLVCR
jgi:hypothetical protein